MTEQKNSLEEIKKEILGELSEVKQEKKGLNWGSVLVTTALIVLLFFSATQVVQSAVILKKINSGSFKSSAGVAAPSSLENLPDMVGGC